MGELARFVGVALALQLAAVTAHAQPASKEPVRLVWTSDAAAATACASAEVVRSDVSSRLGFSPFTEDDPRASSLEVAVTRSRNAWIAQLVMRGADGALRGNRRVESRAADCRSLASATALAIALMIDPELLLRDPPPEPEPPAPPPAPPTPPAAAPTTAPSRPPREPARPRGAVAAGAVVAVGMLPRPALGGALRGELVLHRQLLLAVEAAYLAQQRLTRAGADSALSLPFVATGPCYRMDLGSGWALASCGSFLIGALGLSVASPEPVDAGARPWLAAACGLRLGYRAGNLVVEASSSVLAHLGRREYVVERLDPARTELLFREPAVGMWGGLSAGAVF